MWYVPILNIRGGAFKYCHRITYRTSYAPFRRPWDRSACPSHHDFHLPQPSLASSVRLLPRSARSVIVAGQSLSFTTSFVARPPGLFARHRPCYPVVPLARSLFVRSPSLARCRIGHTLYICAIRTLRHHCRFPLYCAARRLMSSCRADPSSPSRCPAKLSSAHLVVHPRHSLK